MIYRARPSNAVRSWIADKRSAYTHGGETVCPGFHLYRGFVGCPAWAAGTPCTYCYLRTTFNGQRDPELRKGVAWVDKNTDEHTPINCITCGRDFDPRDLDAVFYHEQVPHQPLTEAEQALALCDSRQLPTVNNARAAVTKWLAAHGAEECGDGGCNDFGYHGCDMRVLNAGELADSLGFSPDENPHVEMLLDIFSDSATNPHGHKVLFLTKAGLEATKAHLEGWIPSENVIVSWSVGNGGTFHEPSCSPVFGHYGRLEAAGWASWRGWRTRFRIDPIIWPGLDGIRQWASGVAATPEDTGPELITLGTLRHRGGRVKLSAEERISIYRAALEGLRDGGYEGPVGLCKETAEVIREVLGIEPGEMQCNCVA